VLFSALLAVFTGVLVLVGGLQWRTLAATLRSNEIIERAYVGLSHEPPGLAVQATAPPTARVSVRVTNHGRTPARCTELSLSLLISSAPLPAAPPYAPARPIAAVLTAGDEFVVTLPITAAELAQIQAGAAAYVLGYVDYRDQFGRGVYRRRYARRYDANGLGSNLVFVTEAGYNDERPV
jgi:hypothetical protein